MEFYTANTLKRPVRLCETTRQFAYDSLHFKYGQDTMKTPDISLDSEIQGRELSPLELYDTAIRRICTDAPLRICDGEKISGAATLGTAISHNIPATVKGIPVFRSVSHLTLDFETILKRGLDGIRMDVQESLTIHSGTDKEAFLQSCINTLDSLSIWKERYLQVLRNQPEYRNNYENLCKVPHAPAETFYEAVQSIWFIFAFERLCGNWPGIGRIDVLLGSYLKKDLQKGILTIEEAREILAHFFIKGCEWICGGDSYVTGDAQHYQNLILAGIDESGKEVTNEVTYLVLDILEELGISDFPTTCRLNRNTDEKLIRRIAEVMRFGGGILAVYNEDLVLDAMTGYGYSLEDARRFANDGCWEVQIPGETRFGYVPFDSLAILQQNTLHNYDSAVNFNSFEDLYHSYITDLETSVEGILANVLKTEFASYDPETSTWEWLPQSPCTAVSLFEKGCIQKGLSYLEGGPVYNVLSPHIGGLPDTVNALYAIKKLIYEEKKLSLPEFMRILQNNWEGQESLRQYVLTHYTYYGNDHDEVDRIAVRLLDDFTAMCRRLDGRCGYKMPAGVSTFGRQIDWLPNRLASPHGQRKGTILAANYSPTPGTDKEGATAIIRSYCKSDLKKTVTGAALDIKLLPSSVMGEDGLEALCSLLRGFVLLDGFFMQPDVVDASILRDAQEHPENYQTLSVRVSGWNARFVTLCREWQNMVIENIEK